MNTPIPEIPRSAVPTAVAASGWRRLSPRSAAVTTVALAVFAGLPCLVTGAVLAVTGTLVAAAIVAGCGVLTVAGVATVEWLRVAATRYRVTDERVERRVRLFGETHRSIPRDRIRSVDVSADVVARLLGLARVTVGTGQGDGETLCLASVTTAEAAVLRRELLARGVDPAEGREEPNDAITRLDPRWFGYVPFAAWTPALGLGVFGGLYSVLGWFGDDVANGVALWVWAELRGAPALGAVVALGSVLATGVLTGLAVSVERWWGYRLDREGGRTLRMRRGLLTTTSISLEEERLRGVELVATVPARWTGAARVRAVATGLARSGSQDKGDPSQLTPDLPLAEAQRVAAAVLREERSPLAAARWTAHPRAALRRRLSRALLACAVVAVVAAAVSALVAALPDLAWTVVLLALPPALLYAAGLYRRLGHALHGPYLLVRSGWLRHRAVALRRDGVIGWRITRSPLQRTAGLATIGATTAAGKGVYRAPDVDLTEGLGFADAAVPGLLTPFLERG
ncbi:PH domain-containing protein [Marinactinospora endophytica]